MTTLAKPSPQFDDEAANAEIENDMRATYSAAKRCWRWVLLLWGVATGAAVVSLGLLQEPWPLGCTVLTFACTVASFFLRWRADAWHQTAEALRRTLLLADGLGEQSHPTELARLRLDAADSGNQEPAPIGRYYTSQSPKGWTRVLHNIEESAFYTGALAGRAARLCTTVVVIVLLLAIVVVFLALNLPGPATTARMIGNMTMVGVTAVIGGNFADLGRAYFALAKGAGECLARTQALLDSGNPQLRDTLGAINAYDSALGNSPPIPSFIYRLRQHRLDALWKRVRTDRPRRER